MIVANSLRETAGKSPLDHTHVKKEKEKEEIALYLECSSEKRSDFQREGLS